MNGEYECECDVNRNVNIFAHKMIILIMHRKNGVCMEAERERLSGGPGEEARKKELMMKLCIRRARPSVGGLAVCVCVCERAVRYGAFST